MVIPSPLRAGSVNQARDIEIEGSSKAEGPTSPAKLTEVSSSTPRRLIRPSLPAQAYLRRNGIDGGPLSSAKPRTKAAAAAEIRDEASHAENFYLQKQVQAKTRMVFVLDDGERIEGCIEWYDRSAIKVRAGMKRALIYKRCIKYLYKAGEAIQI
jgi:sRNA-binding regulator protein Hfq